MVGKALVRHSGLELLHLLPRLEQGMVLSMCRVPAMGLVGGMPGRYQPKIAGILYMVTQLWRSIASTQCQILGHGVVDVLDRILRLRKEGALTVQVRASAAMASGQEIRLASTH